MIYTYNSFGMSVSQNGPVLEAITVKPPWCPKDFRVLVSLFPPPPSVCFHLFGAGVSKKFGKAVSHIPPHLSQRCALEKYTCQHLPHSSPPSSPSSLFPRLNCCLMRETSHSMRFDSRSTRIGGEFAHNTYSKETASNRVSGSVVVTSVPWRRSENVCLLK